MAPRTIAATHQLAHRVVGRSPFLVAQFSVAVLVERLEHPLA
jgi:hypothetical protein